MKSLKSVLSCIVALSCCGTFCNTNVIIDAISNETQQSQLIDVSNMQMLDENMVYLGASYLTDCSILFDEQEKVPTSSEDTQVAKDIWDSTSRVNWQPNKQSVFGEASFYLDLGANYVITGMCFLDTNGNPNWTIYNGEPFSWNEIGSQTMNWYMGWRSITFENPESTRYLRFSSDITDSGVSELAIYGYKVSNLTDEQIAKTSAKENTSQQINLTAGQSIGFNSFIDDPITSMMAGGNVREYHNLSWLINDSGQVKFTQGDWGDMDKYYSNLKAQNIDVIPCFQGTCHYIDSTPSDRATDIPISDGADALDPNSYTTHAQALYQVACRYGSNSDIDLDTINISSDQEVKLGLGLLNAVENFNEPNKTWKSKDGYFTPYELACMCSADYDGHEGTIPNAGVKTADPNFKLAMGGLVGYDSMIQYLTEMKTWFDYNRSDGKFAVDIINVHISPNECNPEDSSFVDTINKLQTWIDQNAPNTELWISEYELNMSDCEVENVDNHDNENYQLKYAQRVARTYLLSVGEGVDRISKFQLRDEASGVYYNSGLVTSKGSWSKKLAWYYTSCMTNTLENADFVQAVSKDDVYNYQFKDRSTGDTIYCIWSPTDNNTTIDNYTLNVGDNSKAYLTTMGTYAEGVTSKLDVSNGEISVEVSETPIFITVSKEEKTIIDTKYKKILPSNICLNQDGSTEVCDLSSAPTDSTLNQYYRMFDETNTMPEYAYSNTADLSNPETNVKASNTTCYVNFDKEYTFTGFAVFDTYGVGSIEIYDAHTDTLLWSNQLRTYMCKNIELINNDISTDCLKIVKGDGEMNELAFYGYETPKEVQDTTILGDINSDSNINILDLLTLKKYFLLDNVSINKNNSDINQDGNINVIDLIALKKLILGLK